ncbi:MAG: YbjN domain-containing protein [Myxococcales bacterium]|nr:YbjN domain-containing protein [Myxococcales bacterium]
MPDRTAEVQKRIEEILAAAGYPFTVEEGRCRVSYGSTAVFISAHQWQERYTIVELVAPVLQGVAVSQGLLEQLNTQNEKLYFGKAYWRNDEVWLAHNLLGDRLDNEELIASVGILAVVADHLDDKLKATFGGRRFSDKA